MIESKCLELIADNVYHDSLMRTLLLLHIFFIKWLNISFNWSDNKKFAYTLFQRIHMDVKNHSILYKITDVFFPNKDLIHVGFHDAKFLRICDDDKSKLKKFLKE